MQPLAKFLILTSLWLAPNAGAADLDSCECPKLSCNPECEVEQSVTFYSEKCMGGSRVRSCARPTCVAIPDAPKSCGMAQNAAPAKPATAKEPMEDRAPASVADNSVGEMGLIEGSVWRVVGSKKNALQRGDVLNEGDVIETADNAKAQVLFKSGNVMNITPNSVVRITEMNDHGSSNDKRRAVLDLLKGKIRNKVKSEYKGEQSYFRVKAGAAVAGVRGTDFVVSLHENGDDLISKVETLEGRVELSDQVFDKKILIAKHEGASYVAPKKSVFDAKDKANFVAKGYLTPLYKLSESDIAKINSDTAVEIAKSEVKSKKLSLTKKSQPICGNPAGHLNQCMWSCEGNPAGEKKCRTDLPSVSCVRRICNANGEWSEPMRLPAAYHDSCDASRAVVRPCDY